LKGIFSFLATGFGALTSFLLTFYLSTLDQDTYVSSREVLILSGILGVLLPMGLDNVWHKLKSTAFIEGALFWHGVLLLFSIILYFFHNNSFLFLSFSFIISSGFLVASLKRFSSLNLYFLYNGVVTKILQVLLFIVAIHYKFIYVLLILLFGVVLISSFKAQYKFLTTKYLIFGVQGFLISQLLRLPYLKPFWYENDFMFFDFWLSIAGLFWTGALVFDRILEAKNNGWYSVGPILFLKIFIAQSLLLGLSWYFISFFVDPPKFSKSALILFFSIDLLISIPPFLKYSSNLIVVVFMSVLLVFYFIYSIFFPFMESWMIFAVPVCLYFIFYVLKASNVIR
jgi:hypothetical protein